MGYLTYSGSDRQLVLTIYRLAMYFHHMHHSRHLPAQS